MTALECRLMVKCYIGTRTRVDKHLKDDKTNAPIKCFWGTLNQKCLELEEKKRLELKSHGQKWIYNCSCYNFRPNIISLNLISRLKSRPCILNLVWIWKTKTKYPILHVLGVIFQSIPDMVFFHPHRMTMFKGLVLLAQNSEMSCFYFFI